MGWTGADLYELAGCIALSEGVYREIPEAADPKRVKFDPGLDFWCKSIKSLYDAWGTMPDLATLKSHLEVHLQAATADEKFDSHYATLFAKKSLETAVALKGNEKITELVVMGRGQKLLSDYLTALRVEILSDDLSPDTFERSRWDKPKPTPEEAVLSAKRDLASIRGVEAGRYADAFPEGDRLEQPIFQPTYIDFIDAICDGGLANQDVVGHSAPIGGGKTTLCLQLAWARLERSLQKVQIKNPDEIDNTKYPHIYVCVYEPVQNLRVNFLSNAARITRKTILQYWKEQDELILSSKERRDYKPHELKFLGSSVERAKRGEGPYPNGELERMRYVMKLSNKFIKFVDFSGNEEKIADWSEEGADGIRKYVEGHQETCGNPGVDIVIVDYVGAMVDAQIGSGKAKLMDRTALIKMAPARLLKEVGTTFNCPVWASHQLNSEQNSKAGGTIPDPQKSDGSHMFLERCTIGFASGRLTDENVAVYVPSKQRRGALAPPRVVALDKQYAQWSAKLAEGFTISSGQVMRADEVGGKKRGRFVPTQSDVGFD